MAGNEARGPLSASELLTLIAERAPGLRQAGVLSVHGPGFSLQLAQLELEPDRDHELAADPGQEEPDEEPGDVLDDPLTYGRRASVPGFAKVHAEDGDQ